MPIILPSKPVPASVKSPRVLLLYGQPKVGKTTILTQLPNCLIFDVERGSDYIDAVKLTIENPDDFMAACSEIVNAGRPYKYVALDTISKFESWMEWQATEDYRNTTLGKKFTASSVLHLPNGGGYYWLRTALERHLNKLYTTCGRIILIAHVRDKYISSGDREEDLLPKDEDKRVKTDTESAATDLDLTGKIRNIITAKADAIGYLFRDTTGTLWVSFKSNGAVTNQSRCKHLINAQFPFTWSKIYVD